MRKKKKLSDLALKITEREYRELPYISYSMLSKYEREGFEGYLRRNEEIKTESLIFGSAVDCLLTEGQMVFDQKYCKESGVSGKVKEVLDYLANKEFVNTDATYVETLLTEAFELTDFYKNRKLETRLKMFIDESDGLLKQEYLEYIDKARTGMTVLNEEMYADVQNTVNTLKYSRLTARFFADEPYLEKFYQLKFKAELNGIVYKCMADLIIVDHEDKEIYPVDLKTSSKPEYDFPKSFLKWRYDLQAQLYWSIINAVCKHSPDYADYEVMNYSFIVINRHSLDPLVWKYEDTKNFDSKTYGKYGDIRLRSPFEIGEELNKLISSNATVPSYISRTKPNSIVTVLNQM